MMMMTRMMRIKKNTGNNVEEMRKDLILRSESLKNREIAVA